MSRASLNKACFGTLGMLLISSLAAVVVLTVTVTVMVHFNDVVHDRCLAVAFMVLAVATVLVMFVVTARIFAVFGFKSKESLTFPNQLTSQKPRAPFLSVSPCSGHSWCVRPFAIEGVLLGCPVLTTSIPLRVLLDGNHSLTWPGMM